MKELIIMLVFLALIIAGGYYLTRVVNQRNMKSGSMRVLERMAVARDKYIMVIEIASKVYIIAMSAANTTLIAQMDMEEYLESKQDQPQGEPISFANIFSSVFSKQKTQKQEEQDALSKMQSMMHKRKSKLDINNEQENPDE